jgi:hypothetical protein
MLFGFILDFFSSTWLTSTILDVAFDLASQAFTIMALLIYLSIQTSKE